MIATAPHERPRSRSVAGEYRSSPLFTAFAQRASLLSLARKKIVRFPDKEQHQIFLEPKA